MLLRKTHIHIKGIRLDPTCTGAHKPCFVEKQSVYAILIGGIYKMYPFTGTLIVIGQGYMVSVYITVNIDAPDF